MSDISLYPQGIDIFTTKVDSTSEEDDNYIYAEHVNKIQNAIVAIERSLGTSPQGESESVADRLFSMTKNKALAIPRITIYNGNPISANGSTSKEEAARYFSYFSTVLLNVADPFNASMSDVGLVIEETLKVSLTKFYGTIDAGVSTSNLPLLDVGNIIDKWVEQGVTGVYFKNFGYDFGVSRTRQNELINLAHSKGISIIVSSTNIEHVFSMENLIDMNPSNIPTGLTSPDGYLFLGYALQGSSYQNAAELKDLSNKMITYRSAYGVSMYGLGYIYSGDEQLKNRMYYYGQTITAAYSLNGFHAAELSVGQTFDNVPQDTLQYFRALPIMGNYYDADPVVSVDGDIVSRITEIGKVTVNLSTHAYSFDNLKIPLGFIDFSSDDSKIDASKLTGTLSQDVTINMIARINSDSSGLTISSDKIDVSGTKVIDAINLVAGGTTKIDADAISELSQAHIEDIIIKTVADQLELELSGGTLTGNFRKLLAQFISAQNAYFTTIVGETGTFSGLNAGMLTAGYLDAGLIETNTITSDKLTIHANGGVNKWVGTVVSKAAGVKVPVYSDIFGKDVALNFETVDNNILVTSDKIGSSRTNYVVLLETSVLCSEPYTWNANFTANSNAKLVINGTDIVSCTANQTVPYSGTFIKGWNRVQIYQDHNSETSCSVNIGIKFSTYSLLAETGSAEATGIQRVDAYADRTTQIIGDIIKTGSVDATKITAKTVTADQIKAGTITAAEIQAGTITTDRLNAEEVSAGLVDAGMIQAIEAYIEHLSATSGSFEQLLADILSSKFINANNIKITSEASNLNGDTGALIIDNGGLMVSNLPLGKVSITNEVMTNVSASTYRTLHTPICEDPAPVFSLRNTSTQETTIISREKYALIYEEGQIIIDDDILTTGYEVLATYQYYEEYFPLGSRVVKIDRDGIKISNDGGRPGSWTTKLDGTRLYVGEADISNASITNAHIKDGTIQTAKIGDAQITSAKIDSVDAAKITTGTLAASESVTITAGGGIITLDERGLTSTNFSIGTDGNVSITGTLTAAIGSKIANWNIGENTIYDNNSKIVMDSLAQTISIDSGKVILGKYDTTNYGISASSGFFGSTANKVLIDDKGLVLGTGSIVDTRVASEQKLYISSNGIIAGNLYATSGTINGIQITPEGLQAFSAPAQPDIINNITNITENTTIENNEYITNNYYLQPDSIRVRGAESVIIDTGTLVVKDTALVNRITLGKLSDTLYGLKLDLLNSHYIQLDKDGMRVYDGTKNTIDINSLGNVKITGEINATTGTLGTLTVNGTITAGDTTINTTGISGTGYSLNSNGIVATKGTIAGWTIGTTAISDGNIHIDSTNNSIWIGTVYASSLLKLNADGTATIGKFSVAADGSISTGGGFSVATDGKITATGGTVGGFTLGASSLYSNTNSVILDATGYKLSFNNNAAIFGQYTTGKYGMKVGNFIINGTDSQVFVGSDYVSSAFKIDLATGNATLANATLTSATITGNITSAAGKIGNWTIGTNTLTAGTITLDAEAGTEKIKVTKAGDATKYVQIDGSGLNVVGGVVNIVTGINATDNVTIDSTGIKAGGSAVYAKLDYTGLTITGGAINVTTAISGNKKLEIKSSGIIAYRDVDNRVEIDGDGVRVIKNGSTLGSAITPDGIIGTLLTDQSVPGSKFDKTAPAVPADVNATQVIEQTATSEFINLNITWTAVADADLEGYKVYLKEGSGLYMPMAVVQKTQTSYVIRNVKGATQYYVAVSAYDVTGNESARSTDKAILTTKDTIAPGLVTGLSYVDGPKMFNIRWNEVTQNSNATPCTDLDYYEVQRKTEQFGAVVEDWTLIYKGYTTSFIDKSVAYEYDYSYRVRAVDLSGNTSASWSQVTAGKASKIGAADIVAGSITADVLNVGAMVKGINPNKTILFHFDGVMTSTQDLRPVAYSGGSWVDGKYGDAIALEEATVNMISNVTSGNSNFKNGITGWTNNGATYKATGGIGGTDDGYVEVTSTGKLSVTLTTIVGKKYTISVYGKLAVFTNPSNVIVKANGTEIMNTSLMSEWRRIYYVYTATSTSTTIEFSSSNENAICIDNVQVEDRGFMTAFTESFGLDTGTRLEGSIKYSSEKLNPRSGVVAIWYRPNRVNGSPNTTGQVLFMWGTEPNNYYKLEITNDNKPKWTMASNGTVLTMTHQSVVDAFAWNQITIRWSFDITATSKFAEMYLNGTPVEESNRMDLSTFTDPALGVSYFTLGNHNDGGKSCNGYLDELRIDIEALLDNQEREEIISWFKQGSTFYDVASQIDADSQGISAANARIRINSEGITVTDGIIKVVAEDGITLIGGGRLNVNGMNVGVVQSDNEVYNGNFSVPDSIYSSGDIYTTTAGMEDYGAKFWKIKRSSPGQFQTALLAAIWNTCFVTELVDFPSLYSGLLAQYDAGIRAREAQTHEIETTIRNTPPISLMPEGPQKEALVADTLEDEIKFQIDKATNDKYNEWVDKGISFERYGDANGNTVIKALRFDTTSQTLQYIPSNINTLTGKIDIAVDPNTLSPVVYEASEENGIYGHTIFEVRPQENVMSKTGYARIGANPVHQKPSGGMLGIGDGSTSVFSIPLADMPIAIITAVLVNGVQKTFGVNYIMDIQLGTVTFLPGSIPAPGEVVTAVYNTIDLAAQEVALEQDLLNLITYTDGLEPEETNWKQHIFTFYGKWDNKPAGSQAKLFFEVEELAPSSYDEETGERLPMISIVTTDDMNDQNDFIMGNTDFAAGKYGAMLGHVTWPLYHLNHKTYILDSIRYATILPTLKVRYIRDWINGSTVNEANHWTEIVAVDTLGNTVSLGKTVTSSDTISDPSYVTNGDMSAYAQTSNNGLQWAQVDLGEVYSLGAITVWHFFIDGRTYHNTRTQVSEDGVKWYDVYNSDYQGEYVEAPTGHTIGGLTGMTPNPILVEEIYFDDTGMTLEQKNAKRPQWVMRNDGLLASGAIDSKYISSTSDGDLMMTSFSSDSNIDAVMNFVKSPENGQVVLFVDGAFLSAADVSYPLPEVMKFSYNDVPFGNHVATLITTGDVGFNTDVPGTPKFMLDSLEFYSWQSIGPDYITSVEYIEEDPTAWNKVTIVPNKTNSKESGVPRITTEKVPIKYRVRAKFIKPEGDPFAATAMITGVQAELGQNESFPRVNYGPNSIPAYMIQPFSQFLVRSGITSKQLQNYAPYLDEETGIQERHIADRQVTTSKLAYEAVTGMNIANYNISMDKLAFKSKQVPVMNPSLDSYNYPIVLPVNMDPKVLYITETIDLGTENVYVRGQLQWPGEDYTIEEVVAAVASTDATKQEFATKITFLRDIGVNDRVWVDYWLPTLPVT